MTFNDDTGMNAATIDEKLNVGVANNLDSNSEMSPKKLAPNESNKLIARIMLYLFLLSPMNVCMNGSMIYTPIKEYINHRCSVGTLFILLLEVKVVIIFNGVRSLLEMRPTNNDPTI